MSNTRMDTSILDVIKSGITPFTAIEVEEKVHLGHTMVVHWLKILRSDIKANRPYAQGFKCDKRKNALSHQNQWIYWFER